MSEVKNNPTRETRDMLNSKEKPVRKTTWALPSMLPDPTPEEGYAFRWIRTALVGVADPSNVSSKFREGWEPVKASDHPEVQVMSDLGSRYKDAIEIGGLILCKTPIELVGQRDQYYQNLAASQMTSVDNDFMREGDPRMPLFKERQSKVSFGSGT